MHGRPEGVPIWWIDAKLVEVDPDFHQATLAWLRSLDLDPHKLGPTAAVCWWNGACELHVDEVVQGAASTGPFAGRFMDRSDPMDPDELLTIRRIVRVEVDSWPAMPACAEFYPTYVTTVA